MSFWWKHTAGIMKLILLFAVFAVAEFCNVKAKKWEEYKKKYNKTYDLYDDGQRYTLWAQRKQDIKKHNEGNSTYKMGVNYFTDLYYHELRDMLMAPIKETYSNGTPLKKSSGSVIPDSINWVEKGAVTKVKDQKHCSSSYAFSAAGALEGLMFRTKQKVQDLSAQELVDCDAGNYGCNGGWPQQSFDFVRDRQSIDTDANYPYLARQKSCEATFYNATTCAGYLHIDSEEFLQYAVATYGPTSILFSVSIPSFFFYESGIFDDVCGANQNHAMLAVGYGRDEALGKDYWLVKNSWSDQWGEKGYVKIPRNVNKCQLGEKASLPLSHDITES